MTILVDNFSINVDEWKKVSEITEYSVDVVDLDYTISTSGTYFTINDDIISTTFSPISNGYKATCAVSTISGSQIVTIHSSNSNFEVLELTFNLLFGYHIEYPDYIDWGPNKEVLIYAEARNTTICSNKEIYTTYFRTQDLTSFNLNATIFPTGSVNLCASIQPQSKYLLPGKTYTIKVQGIKDYNNNVLAPFTFSFTVKDV